MEFIKAAWPALACFAIMLALFIHTFRIARRHQVDFLSGTLRAIRSAPHYWRMLTDKAYRRRFRCIERYETRLYEMVTAISARNTLHAISDELLGQAYGFTPDKTALLRRHLERSMTDEFDKARRAMAELLAALSDEDIGILAAYLNDEWYAGRVGVGPIEAWLRQERETTAASPVMAATHLMRAPRTEPLPPDGV